MSHSGCHVFGFWCILVPKCLILGSLGAQWCPKWRPRSSKWCPKGIQKGVALSLFGCPRTDLLPRLLSERSWAPFWLILGPLGNKITDFRTIVRHIWWGFASGAGLAPLSSDAPGTACYITSCENRVQSRLALQKCKSLACFAITSKQLWKWKWKGFRYNFWPSLCIFWLKRTEF